jgi:hypothetical protein
MNMMIMIIIKICGILCKKLLSRLYFMWVLLG